jgi:hypothetical protein
MTRTTSPLQLFALGALLCVLQACSARHHTALHDAQIDAGNPEQPIVSNESAQNARNASIPVRRLGKEGNVSVLQLNKTWRLSTWASYDIWKHSLMISNRTDSYDSAWYVPLRTDTFTMPGPEGRTATTKLVAAPVARSSDELDDILTANVRFAFDSHPKSNSREVVVNGIHVVAPKSWPSSTTLPLKISVVAPPYGQSVSASAVWLTSELQSQQHLKIIAFDPPLVVQHSEGEQSTQLLVIISSDIQLAYSDTQSMEYWLGCIGLQVELLHDSSQPK